MMTNPSTSSALSLGYSCVGAKRGFSATVEPKTEVSKQTKDLLQKTSGGAEISKLQCPPPSQAPKNAAAVQNSSQTRITSAPVVGWPPIQSFRRNLATSSSSKQTLEPDDESFEKEAKLETKIKGLFVKINMDGIPIGRKVDLKAYHSYEKLSSAVIELFRGILTAQKFPLSAGNQRNLQKEQEITGLLDGSGEFTLVYEDDEGDRMLVGDVPWEMFVSTAKRLGVLKSSELSTLRIDTSRKQKENRAQVPHIFIQLRKVNCRIFFAQIPASTSPIPNQVHLNQSLGVKTRR